VVWQATSPPSEIFPCQLGVEYPFSADGVASRSCTAKWSDGTEETFGFTLHVEVTSPTTEVVPERAPDSNGWYNHPLAITFSGQGYSGAAACRASGSSAATTTYAGPDALSATVNATCTDPAGKSVFPSFGLRYDATPPTITGGFPLRPPDFDGWYNHPVVFVFTGTDDTSGIESCTATYAGPDSDSAQVIGTCRDRAGNVASLAVPLHYHATPPLLNVGASPGDRIVLLRWRASTNVVIERSPGLHSPRGSVLYNGASGSFTDTRSGDGIRYTYTLTAKDQAGNVTVRRVSVTPGPRLLSPAANATVTSPPPLRWTPVRGASYYNVQLYLYRGRKVLSVWPVQASLQLNRAWRFNGSNYRLAPGRYSWYVWPRFGPRVAGRYGPPIGSRTFIVKSPPNPGGAAFLF
jgi:hypothetical protein